MIFPTTPSQTVGPFFAIGLPWDRSEYAAAPDAPGLVRLSGSVYDGAGEAVPDSMVESWQADPDGRFADLWGHGGRSELAGFRGFARFASEDSDGSYEIFTVKPGRVSVPRPVGAMTQAPHIVVSVFARGMLHRVVTRIYFADEPDANVADPVLAAVPAERRVTLLAERSDDGYRFDIHLQGSNETVFFAV